MAGTIAFTGASVTMGAGWKKDELPNLWTNLVHTGIDKFKNLNYINAGVSGASNTEIFINTIKVISSTQDLKYLMCSWVALLRYNFSMGVETYDTRQSFHYGFNDAREQNLNTGIISKAYIDNIKNRFFALHHEHHEICRLVN